MNEAATMTPSTGFYNEVDSDIPEEFMKEALKNDPELAEIQEAKSARRAVAEKEETGEEDVADPIEKKEPKAEVKEEAAPEEAADDEFEELEFEDNVIPGLKGEDLKKLGAKAALALSEYHEKQSKTAEKYSAAQAQLDKLLADPVIRDRAEMVAKGKTNYDFRPMTDAERASVVSMIQNKYGLDQDEALGVFNDLQHGFEQYGKEIAEATLHNKVVEKDAEAKAEEVTTKARQVFLNFGKINPKLQFKETNPNNFWTKGRNEQGQPAWVLNESHPEIDNFKENVLPVMSALGKAGLSYQQVVNMATEFGEDAVYTFAAKKLGLPVTINTEKRDQKMVDSAVRKRLKAFLKSSGSDELNADGGSASSVKKTKGSMVDGIDLEKLASSESYYDSVMRKKPNDPAWMDYVSELYGKAMRARNKNR